MVSKNVPFSDRGETRSVKYRHVDLPETLPIIADPESLLVDHPIRYLHRHQCAEIGLCIEGSGVFVVGKKVMEFAVGDVTFINQSEVHLARSMPGTTSRWHWIYLDPIKLAMASRFEPEMLDPAPLSGAHFQNVIQSNESTYLASVAQQMVTEITGREAGFRTNLVALTAQFMIGLRRVRPLETGSPSIGSFASQFERIAPAVALIARSFADPLSTAQLARVCQMSEPSLRRAFMAEIGCSPREYWLDVRLQMAASMLRSTTMSVAEVSQAVGFTTLSSFNSIFRRHFESTPSKWRVAAAVSDDGP